MSVSDNKILQYKDLKNYNTKVKQHIDSKSRSSDISNILNTLYYPYTSGKSLVCSRSISFSIASATANEQVFNTYVPKSSNIIGYSVVTASEAIPFAVSVYPFGSNYYIAVRPYTTIMDSQYYPQSGIIHIIYTISE